MARAGNQFRYVAVDATGRRKKGLIEAGDEAEAFRQLRLSGLAPLSLRPARDSASRATTGRLSERDTIDLIANLGHLLQAGADIRTALGILDSRSSRPATSMVCKALLADIGGGAALDSTFSRHLSTHGALIGVLVSAGEASGDLAAGLLRAADVIESRLKLRNKLGSVLAYPVFVLVSTVLAVLALLLFVVPSLAPLLQDAGATPPLSLRLMIGASELLQRNLTPIGVTIAGLLSIGLIAQRAGLLSRITDRLLLAGPFRKTAAGLVFGAFATVLGGMLIAGAPIADAMRLAARSVRSPSARDRLEPVLASVRQGQSLSIALGTVNGFPTSISGLVTVGEATGALGPMLLRGGKLEEDGALARIETIGQILGPALIVGLGGVVGLLMAALLSGVSQLGQTALQ